MKEQQLSFDLLKTLLEEYGQRIKFGSSIREARFQWRPSDETIVSNINRWIRHFSHVCVVAAENAPDADYAETQPWMDEWDAFSELSFAFEFEPDTTLDVTKFLLKDMVNYVYRVVKYTHSHSTHYTSSTSETHVYDDRVSQRSFSPYSDWALSEYGDDDASYPSSSFWSEEMDEMHEEDDDADTDSQEDSESVVAERGHEDDFTCTEIDCVG